MAMLIENSAPAMHEESQLFSVPVSFTERWRTETERLNPTTVLTDDGATGDINFFIPPSSNGFLDLANVTLELDLAVQVKTDDSNWTFLGKDDLAAPVNNILHSLFQSVQVTLGNRLVSDDGCNYAYRSYMESLLFHTKENALSVLSTAGYHLDHASHFNALDSNPGAQQRRKRFSRDGFVPLSGRLACDIFQQSKSLITGIPVTIRLVSNKKEFYLHSWDQTAKKQFKAVIRNPKLFIKRYVPSPDYLIKITEELQKQTAKYAIERTIMRTTDISKGVQSTVVSNLHMGQLPKVVLLGFVSSDDYCGRMTRNPSFFQHFNITQISVEVDGQSYPSKPYSTNFSKYQYLEAFDGLLNTLGTRSEPYGQIQIDQEDFRDGNTIFGFDLTPGCTGRGPMTLIRTGTLSVSITFETALPETIMMITMLVYDNLIEVR